MCLENEGMPLNRRVRRRDKGRPGGNSCGRAAYRCGSPMTNWALAVAFVALAACLEFGASFRPADAQQLVSPRRIGVLLALLGPDGKEVQAFRHGLRDAGYAE